MQAPAGGEGPGVGGAAAAGALPGPAHEPHQSDASTKYCCRHLQLTRDSVRAALAAADPPPRLAHQPLASSCCIRTSSVQILQASAAGARSGAGGEAAAGAPFGLVHEPQERAHFPPSARHLGLPGARLSVLLVLLLRLPNHKLRSH